MKEYSQRFCSRFLKYVTSLFHHWNGPFLRGKAECVCRTRKGPAVANCLHVLVSRHESFMVMEQLNTAYDKLTLKQPYGSHKISEHLPEHPFEDIADWKGT
ncbi:uncharacterized protein LOC110618487 isoform X2 [Manihot esculenta]|uniref:Uncharacterized protein n=1 Tax=Manihot esculenta TaxID=3983 RepID=A0ACB7HFH7_MANES|nr:uncharacterized protein LOC110618487 isoform X2 [Manihot esculenta]KAG8651529.1 hypothetical protein MANES_07G137650v8 [Manihot esculenta]